MIRYLILRTEMCDWHGCRDAAADLEQIEAQIELIKRLSGETA